MTEPLAALVTFAVVATASPGGATSLATASGAQFGYLRSLPLIFGIATALALLVAVSGTGLAATILAFPVLEFAMKAVGSAYLLWLAFVILKAGSPAAASVSDKSPIGFFGGAMLLGVNPKAWAMAVGVAGSFSGISDNPYALAAVLGSVFAIAATLSLSMWTVAGSFLARIIRENWQWHVFNAVMALLLVSSIASFWI
ncbi:LysE family transporter [Anderseniella sp. Alg231-50]|uniref:LysE family transporter n=1 Tax=Anderseniella sp. Alg231-50 TaxID=1922226 RepID=UPI000D558A86